MENHFDLNLEGGGEFGAIISDWICSLLSSSDVGLHLMASSVSPPAAPAPFAAGASLIVTVKGTSQQTGLVRDANKWLLIYPS